MIVRIKNAFRNKDFYWGYSFVLFYCSKCVNMMKKMGIWGSVMNDTKKTKIRDKKQELTRLADRVYRNTVPLLLTEAALFAIIGLVMMIKPVDVLTAITFVVGAVLVLLGLYRVSMVFVSNQGITAGTFDVFFGLVTFILGVVFCIFPHGVNVISLAPKLAISVCKLHVPKSLKNH